MNAAITNSFCLFVFLGFSACAPGSCFTGTAEFHVHELPDGSKEIHDGMGRRLVLVPRDNPLPKGIDPSRVIRTPVKRVVVYSDFNMGLLRALGVLDKTLVGVTKSREHFSSLDVQRGMDSGRITYLGQSTAVDMERLKSVAPDVVFTWDQGIIPLLDNLGIQVVITSTPTAMSLQTRLHFIEFLALFFHKDKEAKGFVRKVEQAFHDIRRTTKKSKRKPRVIWGDIYPKRVLVEPVNAWASQLVEYAGGDYVLDDVYGAACLEITLEKFYLSGQKTDVLFTYRSSRLGIDSKEKLMAENPQMTDIRPFHQGKVYCPQDHYHESSHKLDEILREIAAILHPELYPNHPFGYFRKL
jgi:iron complex transport system substrate-binding protein